MVMVMNYPRTDTVLIRLYHTPGHIRYRQICRFKTRPNPIQMCWPVSLISQVSTVLLPTAGPEMTFRFSISPHSASELPTEMSTLSCWFLLTPFSAAVLLPIVCSAFCFRCSTKPCCAILLSLTQHALSIVFGFTAGI